MSDSFSSQPPGTQRFGIEIPIKLNELISFMEERLKCCICLCNLAEPVRLPCNHIYCQECLKSAIKHSKCCPECRSKFVPRQAKVLSTLGNLSNDLTNLLPKLQEFADSKMRGTHNLTQSIDNEESTLSSTNLVQEISDAACDNQSTSLITMILDPENAVKDSPELCNKENVDFKSSPPPQHNSHSSKESFKRTVSFTEDAIQIMDMNTDDMLNNPEILGELDNLIKYAEKKPKTDVPTDDLFDELSFSPCVYLHESLREIDLPIQHETELAIVDHVVIPSDSNTYLLESLLAFVNKCFLIKYVSGDINLQNKTSTLKLQSMNGKVIVYPYKNSLLSYIIEAQGGLVLDHYPHDKIAKRFDVVQISELSEIQQFTE
eukprot:NODE_11_length_46995_cov_0.451872.p14 type:complete len:376 gc:universal NODE_11_length_46995_cov_0.451872:2614-3741(+)